MNVEARQNQRSVTRLAFRKVAPGLWEAEGYRVRIYGIGEPERCFEGFKRYRTSRLVGGFWQEFGPLARDAALARQICQEDAIDALD